jgi:hypothetical protein
MYLTCTTKPWPPTTVFDNTVVTVAWPCCTNSRYRSSSACRLQLGHTRIRGHLMYSAKHPMTQKGLSTFHKRTKMGTCGPLSDPVINSAALSCGTSQRRNYTEETRHINRTQGLNNPNRTAQFLKIRTATQEQRNAFGLKMSYRRTVTTLNTPHTEHTTHQTCATGGV